MNPDQYYSQLSRRLTLRTDTFQMYRCQFAGNSSQYPKTGWLKVYSQHHSEEPMRELSFLMEFQQRFGDQLPVVQLLHHCVYKGEQWVFLGGFDSILDETLRQRARRRQHWSEGELWEHLLTLMDAVFKLHAMRVVHRNICLDTVFVSGERVLLGQFENAKHIPRGVTERSQTIRGTDQFLTPQTHSAYYQGNSTTYEISMKDDIWAIGRLLFDMATLTCNKEVMSYYDKTQTQLNAYIASALNGRYSDRFLQLICRLMSLAVAERPSSEDVMAELGETFVRCKVCRLRVMSAKWPCGHFVCGKCLEQYLTERIVAGEGRMCGECEEMMDPAVLSNSTPRSRQLADLLLIPTQSCSSCKLPYPRAKAIGKGALSAYEYTCPCGAVFCSFCRRGPHRILGVSKKCPDFPYLDSQASSPKSSLLSFEYSSKSILNSTQRSCMHRRVMSGPVTHQRKHTLLPANLTDFTKGMKLLYRLHPLRPANNKQKDFAFDEGSKVAQTLLTPVRMSLRIKRSSMRPGESGTVISHLFQVLHGKSRDSHSPIDSLSDVERLYIETKSRVKRRKHRVVAREMQVMTAAPSPEESFLLPQSPVLPPEPQKSRSPLPCPKIKTHPSRPKTLLIDLPALPFSKHKTYNEEQDFMKRHVVQLQDDAVRNDEPQRNLLSHHTHVRGPLKEWLKAESKRLAL